MTTKWRWIMAIAATAAVVASCTDWSVWDDVFERHPAEGTRGWTGGDGAIAIALDTPERTLWLFGDSTITGYDAATNEKVWFGGDPQEPAALGNILFGTNIALQRDANTMNPDPAMTDVFARQDGRVVDIDGFVDPPEGPRSFQPFFSYEFLGLTRPAGDGPFILWPHGGYYDSGKLVLSLTEVGGCEPSADPECFPMCAVLTNAACDSGLKILQRYVARIGNVTAAPAAWTTEATYPMGAQVGWGNAFVPEDSDADGDIDWIYVYGARQLSTGTDAVIARAKPAQIKNPNNWQFRIAGTLPAGCSTTATLGAWADDAPTDACALHEVADDVGVLYSAHRIERFGIASWLLVHTQPGQNNLLAVRTSSTPLGFRDVDESTPRIDLGSIDSSIQMEVYAKYVAGLCHPELLPDTRALTLFEQCSITYHGRAHEHLSWRDADGISALLFSYIVPNGPQGNIQSAEYYRPRFSLIPIDNLPPFCAAAGAPCLRGVVYQGYRRTLGSQAFDWGFDVRRARGTQFYATFTGGTGDPQLSVSFGSPANTSACCTNTSGTTAECRCTVPSNAKTAWVRVSGSGSFDLRTQYRDTELGFTPWLDRDSPNATGDYETLPNFRTSGEVCASPTEVQCRRRSDRMDASTTLEIVTCDTTSGFSCRNADQPDGRCDDYEVRFYCGPTPWMSRDTPNATGDYESVSGFVADGRGCEHPTHIECRRRSDGLDHRAVGENVSCNAEGGFSCRNADQPDGRCDDYEVRLFCGAL